MADKNVLLFDWMVHAGVFN